MKRVLVLLMVLATVLPLSAVSPDLGLSIYPQWGHRDFHDTGESEETRAVAFVFDLRAPLGEKPLGFGIEAQVGLPFQYRTEPEFSMEGILNLAVRMGPTLRYEPTDSLGLAFGLGLDVDIIIDRISWRGSMRCTSNIITTGLYGRIGIDFTVSSFGIGIGAIGTWTFLQHIYSEETDTFLNSSTIKSDAYRGLTGWAFAPTITFSYAGRYV